ncbi:MAG: Tex-like N-terminal domain-containing protein, partial [Ligilactobacillus agilis]|nr:Tex-like N-terminal domain-containing protein [Ligilactobacillus agilis]
METAVLNETIKALNYRPRQVRASLELLAAGKTVPFIARYRKEMTGSLDEVALREIQATYNQLEKLSQRKQEVLTKIAAQEKLTPKLAAKIKQATSLQAIEDLYLPYKQKRRTKAQIAKEQGLAPLAAAITRFESDQALAKLSHTLLTEAVTDEAAAFLGAHEILAEAFGEDARLRAWVRQKLSRQGQVVASLKDESQDEQGVYQDYYDYEQPLKKLASHQVLALDRGERQGVLKVKLVLDEAYVLNYFHSQFVAGKPSGKAASEIRAAYTDAYKRFIKPAIEREVRKQLTEQAASEAIEVFGANLYHLLMQAPLKGKVILGLDPGFRTGCKLAVVDATGKFLAKAVIYPHEKAKGAQANPKLRAEAKRIVTDLITRYQVEMVAIGNGTASRESEQFIAEVLGKLTQTVYYVIVNEAGASVYSASANARAEFPDLNVEERSAISIARRLQDPLAELIKIDPKSIGVGQYQHDLPQKQLDEKLAAVIETGVNQVGVNLNTASPDL